MTDPPGQRAWRAARKPVAAEPQYWMPEAFRLSAVQTMISSRSGRIFLTVPTLTTVRRGLRQLPVFG